MKPKKHVIFLGAGASITSGYPDANRLAVLMCDRGTFLPELFERMRTAEDPQVAKTFVFGKSAVRKYYDSFANAVQLLRSGDFATMDELSSLALGGEHAGEIGRLKELMRFVFALNNPDITHWAKSDYRPLIQALFERKSLLREDVSIISFNYDPYFEYRLLRALRARAKIRPPSTPLARRLSQAATSGFLEPNDLEWTRTEGFCHIKLHGTCAFPATEITSAIHWPPQPGEPENLTTEHLFRLDTPARFSCLSNPQFAAQAPPALLPWEIISPDGKLLEAIQFEAVVGTEWQHKNLYPLFRALWERARADVQEADKLSFVGLSIGPFMEPELKFLFEGKRNIVEAVVANPEAQRYAHYAYPFHPNTFCGRMLDVFQRICPGMGCNRSNSEGGEVTPTTTDRDPPLFSSLRDASEMTVRTSFADFIQREV